MGAITVGIENKIRYRNKESKQKLQELMQLLPLVEPDFETDFETVQSWMLDMTETLLRNPSVTQLDKFYMNRVIQLSSALFEDEVSEAGIGITLAKLFRNKLEQIMPTKQSAFAIMPEETYSMQTMKEILHEVTDQRELLEWDELFHRFGDKCPEQQSVWTIQKKLDMNNVISNIKKIFKKNSNISRMMTKYPDSFRTALDAAFTECIVMDFVLEGRMSGKGNTVKNEKVEYLKKLMIRCCNSVWRSKAEQCFAENGPEVEKYLLECVGLINDKEFFENIKDDFSFWNKLQALALKREYYEPALQNFKQKNKAAQLQDQWDFLSEQNIFPKNELLKQLICSAVNHMKVLLHGEEQEYSKAGGHGAFDTTIVNKSSKSGWFQGNIHEQPKEAQVYREHIFVISFAMKFSINDTEMLLTDGAHLEGFDFKNIRESIYYYCLYWHMSYVEAQQMWLDCIRDMLRNSSKKPGFCDTKHEPVGTISILDNVEQFCMTQSKESNQDQAFLQALAAKADILSIEEFSEWLVEFYMRDCSFGCENDLENWFGADCVCRIMEKLQAAADTLKNRTERAVQNRKEHQNTAAPETQEEYEAYIQSARKTARHSKNLLEEATAGIQKILEDMGCANLPRMQRSEDAQSLSDELLTAWKNLCQDQDIIENPILQALISESWQQFQNGSSKEQAVSRMIEGKHPVTNPVFGCPLTEDLLKAHQNGKSISRADIFRYCFWITLLNDNHGSYDPEKAFQMFRSKVNGYLESSRFPKFYVRISLDRIFYMAFWWKDPENNEINPILFYQNIWKNLLPRNIDKLSKKQIQEWRDYVKEQLDGDGDEVDHLYRKIISLEIPENPADREKAVIREITGTKATEYLKAIVWLCFHGDFDKDNVKIWPQLFQYLDIIRKDDHEPADIERIKEKFEKDKEKALQKAQANIDSIQKQIETIQQQHNSKIKELTNVQSDQAEHGIQHAMTKLEQKMKEIEPQLVKALEAYQEANSKWSAEFLEEKFAKKQEESIREPEEFVQSVKNYFINFYSKLADWFGVLGLIPPEERLNFLKNELSTLLQSEKECNCRLDQ